jgi:hypothetical protein
MLCSRERTAFLTIVVAHGEALWTCSQAPGRVSKTKLTDTAAARRVSTFLDLKESKKGDTDMRISKDLVVACSLRGVR